MRFPPGLVGGNVFFDHDVFAAGDQNRAGFGVPGFGNELFISVDDVHFRKVRSFGKGGAELGRFLPGGGRDLSSLLRSYDGVASGIVPDVQPAVVAVGEADGDLIVVARAAADDNFETVA